ncbi:MAG: tyrosine-type recombinase/integrase [Pirellulaceae bacterium]|nr:tyrosine-type recombinase/integrase [Pirellulaceae bacterium]
MLLSEVLERYEVYRSIKPAGRYQIDRSIRIFSEWLGRPADTEDLTSDTVSKWVASMETAGRYAIVSVREHRNRVLLMWRFAAKRGWSKPLDDVRVISKPDPMPTSWTLDEVKRLLKATELPDFDAPIHNSSANMGLYLRALIRTAYETGLRKGDLMSLDRSQIATDGSIEIRMRKTGWGHHPRVSAETMALIRALPGRQPLAWPCNERQFYYHWNRLLGKAKVRRGCLHQLRRTGASHIARDHGLEAAKTFLGHRDPLMFRHYVDQKIAKPPCFLPPSIDS